MKIEVIETFYGRPDETKDFIMFLAGVVVDVTDDFGHAMIEKGHAKLAGPAKHVRGSSPTPPVPQQTEEKVDEA